MKRPDHTGQEKNTGIDAIDGRPAIQPFTHGLGVSEKSENLPMFSRMAFHSAKVMKIYFRQLVIFCGILTLPGIAHANAGVPMLFVAMPAFAFSIIPIIIIEAIYLSKKLKLSRKAAGKTVTLSNLVSTVVGIPLTWGFLVVVQMVTGGGAAYGIDTFMGKVISVTWQAPWLIPYESELYWMIPVAGMVLLVPFFFASWWSEYLVSKKMHRDLNGRLVKKYVRNANLITYGLFTIWPIALILFSK